MTTYAITGSGGFLAWHLRCRLKAEQPDADVRLLKHGDLEDCRSLAEVLDGCSAVFHLAGVNSHEARDAVANVHIAEALAGGLDLLPAPPHVVFSNSIHALVDSPYGRAKRDAANVLHRWATQANSTFANVMLPNLFGEMSRPYYNSAVATFCDAILHGKPCEVNRAGRTELLHAQDAAAALCARARSPGMTTTVEPGVSLAVADIYDRLSSFHDIYRSRHTVPSLPTQLDIRLFNQLRAALYPDIYPVSLIEHRDQRGVFFEAARGFEATQVSFSSTHPGLTRGEHWHADKIERFLVLRGSATIEIRRLFDDTIRTFTVGGTSPAFVDMPTLHAHNITNTGNDELLTMFWANDHFCADNPDTWPEPVRVPTDRKNTQS